MNKLLGLLAIVIAGLAIPQISRNSQTPVVDCSQVKIGKIKRYWTEAGIIVGDDYKSIKVDDKYWPDLPHDAKVSIAIALFCDQNPNGVGSSVLWGYRSGNVVASVENGSYFSND